MSCCGSATAEQCDQCHSPVHRCNPPALEPDLWPAAGHCGFFPLLRQVAADEPLDESLQARPVLLLGASGQQAPALSHYQAVRARLNDELGVDPGSEPQTAHGQALRQELRVAATTDEAGAIGAPSPLVPPAKLTRRPPTFVGREAELSQVSTMLSPDTGLPIGALFRSPMRN